MKYLITGGLGYLGIELAYHLSHNSKNKIVIYDKAIYGVEHASYVLNKKNISLIVGDIRDKERCQLAIRNVDIVFHAAAMKHIDICEQNPFDAVKTNVIGTSNMLEVSIIEGISKFIFISTDKATNPTSTLGASKLLAERLTLDAGSSPENNKMILSAEK